MIGMKSRTKKVINMLEDLFSNKYDPFLFSIDFPNFCFENYDDLEKENKGLGYYLDQKSLIFVIKENLVLILSK